MKAVKKTKKVPKAQAGMIIGTALSAVPQAIAAYQGYKASKQAAAEDASLKAMMPSLSSQEDYYNFYQKTSQLNNEAKLQRQMDQQIAASAKMLSDAGTRGVLGGASGVVGRAQQAKADIAQQQGQQLLGAYEKMIGAKDADRARIMTQRQLAQQAQTSGMATMLQGLQGLGDTALQGGLEAYKIKQGFYKNEDGGTIEKTPGEFSHDRNPIDVVQDGEKIAEMTGGEYIFNPKQMETIKKMVASNKQPELHKYMKSLIRKFEKKAKK